MSIIFEHYKQLTALMERQKAKDKSSKRWMSGHNRSDLEALNSKNELS